MWVGNYYINYQTVKKVRKVKVVSFGKLLGGFCSVPGDEEPTEDNLVGSD
jgi:hypothetical protein